MASSKNGKHEDEDIAVLCGARDAGGRSCIDPKMPQLHEPKCGSARGARGQVGQEWVQ
jgi:hypothetical protein